ncbi:MAG: DUF192 domain-containing protein [Candidatus ainarchaeum sp.]|nr:DUF192 domain-containing protein [Candidatus ainarchaeum sp.]
MLINKSDSKKIISKVRIADSSWKRLRGLMFENQALFDYALVFDLPRESVLNATIHMLFVFFPIDVVFLDKNRKVVDIIKSLQPFTPSCSPKKPAKFLIELPAGKANGISEGNELEWNQK